MAIELAISVEESGLRRDHPEGDEHEVVRRDKARVAIAPRWIAYDGERQGRRVALDLDRRRRFEIDELSGAYSDDSLFAVVGMRHIELPNRAHVREVLEAGGTPAATEFAPLFVEHQLAIKDPALKTTIGGSRAAAGQKSAQRGWRSLFGTGHCDIDVRASGADVIGVTDGRRLMTHSPDGLREPEAVRGFVQFVRYRYGGHPLLLEHLAALDFVPRKSACTP